MKKHLPFLASLLTLFLCSACYSFKGISIDPSINTFNVALFDDAANGTPPNYAVTFTERLRDKIRSESRLTNKDIDPDIQFSGSVTSFRVTAEAPEPGETTSFNRLTITVKVEYVNNRDEDNKWTKSFSYFDNFDAATNLLDVQEQLIITINNQLVEDIFNFAFTNW